MHRLEMTKSLEVRPPHFQKDVIIPQIYDLKNIKVVHDHGYKDSPVNKVAELKKKKIQNVIKGIVNKHTIETTQSKPLYQSLSIKKQKKVIQRQSSYSKGLQNHKKQILFMQIDEQIGEMIALADENFLPFADRVKTVLHKVKHNSEDQELMRKTRDADFFMNVLCHSHTKKTNPQKIRPIQGLIDELNQMQSTGREQPKKRRVQSAGLTRSKSAYQHSPNLYKSRQFNRSNLNIKHKSGLEDQLNKSKQIIKTINDCLEVQKRVNRKTHSKMHSMKGEWAPDGTLQKTFIRSSNMIINPSTLNVLKDKRLKIEALSRIDNQYLRK